MNPAIDQFVSKVHPATREVEAEDPMELQATPTPGDPAVMLKCLVQEYASLGFTAGEIARLFRDPDYPALNALADFFGDGVLRQRIDEILQDSGVLRFSGHVVEEPDDDDDAELIQLTVRERSAD
jgi:hypothetical protein